MLWLWKVTYDWIREYFRILYKSIGHIQSNEEIWGENHMLTVKEVPLCCSCDKGVTKYAFSYNSRSYGKITST
jgi:hypothetical protein